MSNDDQRKGTRCAVCVMCGKCFEDEPSHESGSWSGSRCAVCVSCGKCAKAWGLVGGENVDALTGPTVWGGAARAMDTGSAGAPPPMNSAPGVSPVGNEPKEGAAEGAGALSKAKPSNFACLRRGADGEEVDATTGATPGVSSACKEHGFDDMNKLIADLGIKPPGVA